GSGEAKTRPPNATGKSSPVRSTLTTTKPGVHRQPVESADLTERTKIGYVDPEPENTAHAVLPGTTHLTTQFHSNRNGRDQAKPGKHRI
ncbi:hypothetical protein, partial [Actinoalloteichus spitiensis]|uniref:hypothetical protein n=1 Tax=Actinoalloteichus spitiensis TaxID=252394 RepID=UPI001B7F8365